MYGASTNPYDDKRAGQETLKGGILGIAGDTLSGLGTGAMTGAMIGSAGGPITAIGGAILGSVAGLAKGLLSNAATIKSATDMMNDSLGREGELA
jgi:hypothetical protein